MDFSYPQEAEQFGKELRSWLSEHLSDDVIDAGTRRGSDDAAFETLRSWNATMSDAGWAAGSWPREHGGRGATPLGWATDQADDHERHLAALRVKAFSGRLATVGDRAIQVFGGIGFTWEHDAHLYLKRLLSFSRFLGSAGSYQERLGRKIASTTS